MAIQSSSSDISMIRTVTTQINSTQKELYALQQRATSNFKHEHYYNMDPIMADQSIYVEALLSKNSLEIQNCEWSESLLYMQESSLKRFTDIIEKGRILAVQGFNDLGIIATPDMVLTSKSMLSIIEDELSASYFGMNIWNGSRTNEIPCEQNSLVNGTIGANYYLGDNFNLQLYTYDDSVVYGDRANLECFRDLIQALQLMRDSQNTSTGEIDKTDVQNASDLLNKAQVGFSALLQHIGNVEQLVISTKENAQENLANLSELFVTNLNGMSEEDRAINLIDAAAVQRKLGYILPITMKYLNDMSIVKYL